MSLTRKLASLGVVGAVGLGLVAVPAVAQEDTPENAEAAGPRAGNKAERRATMAAELGISVEDLETAAMAARDSVIAEYGEVDRENTDPAQMEERRNAFAAALAAELGVSAEQLETARSNVFNAHMADLVAEGTITQEQADAMIAAYNDGTLREYMREQRTERLTVRITDAVAEGTITQGEADEILAAIENGTLKEYIQARRDAGEPPLPIGPGPGGPRFPGGERPDGEGPGGPRGERPDAPNGERPGGPGGSDGQRPNAPDGERPGPFGDEARPQGPIPDDAPAADEAPETNEAPEVDEAPAADETPAADEAPVTDEAPDES